MDSEIKQMRQQKNTTVMLRVAEYRVDAKTAEEHGA
jgi:hypothetical protein